MQKSAKQFINKISALADMKNPYKSMVNNACHLKGAVSNSNGKQTVYNIIHIRLKK